MLFTVLLILHFTDRCFTLQPPIWPDVYSVDFVEEGHTPGAAPFFQNNGSWYYNFSRRIARFDKGQGQHDEFCQLEARHLSPKDPNAPCQLLFASNGSMYVIYPNTKKCCYPCGEKQQCSLIKPNWLANSTYIGNKTFEGNTCYGWEIDGSTTKDYWYVTDKNVPCYYVQTPYKVGGTISSLTFKQESYKLTITDPSIFAIPEYCKNKCFL